LSARVILSVTLLRQNEKLLFAANAARIVVRYIAIAARSRLKGR